ncbi:MAG TPA: prepilin-type N-terminal cleavage/methylation domain-containing protein [bacterium]|nr:prepilin-type N-terminal cleavage/methylation domain-containing protein [bacterium]HPT29919.1 prepilin-type N-terminal cleavage/methylation domain-containing protein [bacterium]
MMIKQKKGFTLVELLVVIAIIGLLASLSVVALSSARARSRDAKRVGDVKQVQTALELFFNDQGRYPTPEEWETGSIMSSSSNPLTTYLKIIPAAPTTPDGNCTSDQNTLYYQQTEDGASYTLSYCLGNNTGSLASGPKCATPGGVYNSDCSLSGSAGTLQATITWYLSPATNPVGTINYGSGNYTTNGSNQSIQVYAYKLIDGYRYVSDAASIDVTDDSSSGSYNIDWSWTASPDADGYLVLKSNSSQASTQYDIINKCQTAEGTLQGINDRLTRIRELMVMIEGGTFSLNDIRSITQEAIYASMDINGQLEYLLSLDLGMAPSVTTDLQDMVNRNNALRTQLDLAYNAATTGAAQGYATAARILVDDFITDIIGLLEYLGGIQTAAETAASAVYYKDITTNSIQDSGYSAWDITPPDMFYFSYGAYGISRTFNAYSYHTESGLKVFSSTPLATTLIDDGSYRYYDVLYSWELEPGEEGVRLMYRWNTDPPTAWYYTDVSGTSVYDHTLTSWAEGANPPANEEPSK